MRLYVNIRLVHVIICIFVYYIVNKFILILRNFGFHEKMSKDVRGFEISVILIS